VIVHRLLQATLEGNETVEEFPLDVETIGKICAACNTKKDGSRKAQERSDVVFLALYLRRYPKRHVLGVVLSVGKTAFTVFLPSLGVSALVYLEEHRDWIAYTAHETSTVGCSYLELTRVKKKHQGASWKNLVIKNFVKLSVTCKCSETMPLTVKLELEGPWA
jgi:exoribonuclease R